jgi:hypothetical protein
VRPKGTITLTMFCTKVKEIITTNLQIKESNRTRGSSRNKEINNGRTRKSQLDGLIGKTQLM